MRAVILDGHNDLALRVWQGRTEFHVDLAAAAGSGFAGGFFALGAFGPPIDVPAPPYALPLAAPIPIEQATADVEGQLAALEGLDLTIVRRADEIVPARVNAIVHFEGAEPIAPDLSDLEDWYRRGLRSLGIVWSRPNAFAEGVPFRFPSSPDTGPGLTAAGRDLVHACNLLGILVDLSHLNEAGFWDVAELTQAPLVATHSNAHALCASTRNLTDAQLDAIGASGGVVGINFGVMFLREDGTNDLDTPLEQIVRHIDYVAERIGIDHVAFGSDFDGAEIPDALGGIAGLPDLVEALRRAGHDDESLAKITHGNWLRVLGDTWRPWSRYFRLAGFDARPTLIDAADRFPVPGLAVDLGAGTGRDTLELLRRGWRVIAIDSQQEAIDRVVEIAGEDAERLEGRVGRFEDAEWPACELVNASFALPFTPSAAFPALWQRIVDSLVPGGRFSGQLFGDRDEWARTGLVVKTRAEVEELLRPFEVERFEELEEEGQTVLGNSKLWHLFHIVARKR
ncbi:MAG TPA: membrane dipeptidase [Gaiellaceae bacterium]|jgi:membrane dipeptidase|nr:membrane dipeptidase [Gaiellaceae bacterium]